jgi:hypothetical protein
LVSLLEEPAVRKWLASYDKDSMRCNLSYLQCFLDFLEKRGFEGMNHALKLRTEQLEKIKRTHHAASLFEPLLRCGKQFL